MCLRGSNNITRRRILLTGESKQELQLRAERLSGQVGAGKPPTVVPSQPAAPPSPAGKSSRCFPADSAAAGQNKRVPATVEERGRGGQRRGETRTGWEKSLKLNQADLRVIPKSSSRVVETPFTPGRQQQHSAAFRGSGKRGTKSA